MTAQPAAPAKGRRRIKWVWIFPAGVMILYGALYFVLPERTAGAVVASTKIARFLGIPLAFVVSVLFLMNLFVRSSQVAGFLGQRTGAKAMILSIVAGIISAGPIYAWYPLLKDLKEQGAREGHIAVFLYSRAMKPFLLPVIIEYFGWRYVVVLTFLMILISIVVGYGMEVFSYPAHRRASSNIAR